MPGKRRNGGSELKERGSSQIFEATEMRNLGRRAFPRTRSPCATMQQKPPSRVRQLVSGRSHRFSAAPQRTGFDEQAVPGTPRGGDSALVDHAFVVKLNTQPVMRVAE